jgi:hypothetical protein
MRRLFWSAGGHWDLRLSSVDRFAQQPFLEFRLGRTLAVSLRLTEPSYILFDAMPQKWNSLGIA